jgi:hypothetical protein
MVRSVDHRQMLIESDLSDAATDEFVTAVEQSAERAADLVGQHLDGVVEHLKSLGCVDDQQIADYAARERQVLVDLYRELCKAGPSPTNVLRLALQYGLDAREEIKGDIRRFDLRRKSSGWEIIDYRSPALKMAGVEKPGRLITNAFAVAIFDFLSSNHPPFYRMRLFLEAQLGEVPKEENPNKQSEAELESDTARIRVDLKRRLVYIDGQPIGADLNVLYLIDVIAAAKGRWISGPEIKRGPQEHSDMIGARPDRVFKRLPASLKNHFESQGGKGFRLLTV